MTFPTFIRILVTRWKFAVTALLACLLGAAFVTQMQTKHYEASTTVLVSFSGATNLDQLWAGTQAAQERLSSYARVAGSRAVVERAVSQLQLSVDPADVLSQTEVKSTLKSMLLTITVKDTDPERAAALVGAIANQFGAIVPTLGMSPMPGETALAPIQRPTAPGEPQPAPEPTPVGHATVVDPPQVPSTPISPVPLRNMAIGLAAGILLGIAVALIRESSDHTVRNRDTLEEISGLPTLAELPERRGAAPQYDTDLEYDDALRGLAARLRRTVGPDGRRVLLTSPFGGEGTTTTALDLSYVLTDLGEDVLLVEGGSRRADIAPRLNVESERGLAEVLADPTVAADAPKPTDNSRLRVLASRSVTTSSSAGAYPAELIDDVLTELSTRIDRIVIDGPPVLATEDTGLLAGVVNATVLVVRAGRSTVDEVNDAISALRASDADIIGIVLTGTSTSQRNKAAARKYRKTASGSA